MRSRDPNAYSRFCFDSSGLLMLLLLGAVWWKISSSGLLLGEQSLTRIGPTGTSAFEPHVQARWLTALNVTVSGALPSAAEDATMADDWCSWWWGIVCLCVLLGLSLGEAEIDMQTNLINLS